MEEYFGIRYRGKHLSNSVAFTVYLLFLVEEKIDLIPVSDLLSGSLSLVDDHSFTLHSGMTVFHV